MKETVYRLKIYYSDKECSFQVTESELSMIRNSVKSNGFIDNKITCAERVYNLNNAQMFEWKEIE